MSFDEKILVEIVEAAAQAGLQIILIGNVAAIVHGAPVLTRDVDFMVREHSKLQEKLLKFAEIYGVKLTCPYAPLAKVIRAIGRSVPIDFVFSLSSGKSFESVRSRAHRIRLGRKMVWVASLEDIIAAKRSADRPKDKAVLQILEETWIVQKAMAKKKRKNNH